MFSAAKNSPPATGRPRPVTGRTQSAHCSRRRYLGGALWCRGSKRGEELVKHLLAAVALALSATASQAEAEWKKIYTESDLAIYVDIKSVRLPADDVYRMWTLWSFKQAQKSGYRSYKSFYEIDCQKESVQTLSNIQYSGAMGDGRVTMTHPEPQQPSYFPPGSIMGVISDLFCKTVAEQLEELRTAPK